MSTYNDCVEQAKQIGQRFHELVYQPDDKQKRFFVEYPDVTKIKLNNVIVVLGLNPAGDDSSESYIKQPNLFSYVPRQVQDQDELSEEVVKTLKYYSCEGYFKTFIEMFGKLSPPYHPIWYNRQVLNDMYELNKDKLSQEIINSLKFHVSSDNGNYIIFTDLIQYCKTNSKEIISHLWREDVKDLIKNYVKMLFAYLRPKLVLAANASVSHFIRENFTDEIVKDDVNETSVPTKVNLFGTEVLLGSMLTGQRAMDIYSRQRLFNEIQQQLHR